jgi:hypothetical protein
MIINGYRIRLSTSFAYRIIALRTDLDREGLEYAL